MSGETHEPSMLNVPVLVPVMVSAKLKSGMSAEAAMSAPATAVRMVVCGGVRFDFIMDVSGLC